MATMASMNPASLRLPSGHGLERGMPVKLSLDGRPVTAYEGESVAGMLLAEGHVATRTTQAEEPRGVYCGMGVCFDCLVVVDGVPNTRACVTWVREGMVVSRQDGLVALTPDQ
jgi:predicted molibdopterin-dependent oxidoreductase YjgC